MSLKDELARALADQKYYNDEIAKHTDIRGTRKKMVSDMNSGEYEIEEPYEELRDDGWNESRKAALHQINQNVNRLREYEAGRQDAVNLATENARNQLAQRLGGVRAGANQRGALYGGFRQGMEAKQRAASAGELGKNVSDINTKFEEIYDKDQQGLIGNQVNQYRDAVNKSQMEYKKALSDYKNRSGTASSIGSAIGTIGGALLPF